MDLLIHLFAVLTRNRFLVLAAVITLAVLGSGLRRRRAAWAALAGVAGLACFFAGPYLNAALLYRIGQTATAQVTGTFATWINDNDRDVKGYNVVIRQADDIISTYFEDDELNLYPVPGSFAYPQPNESFTVRVLPGFPRDFVIVTDDDSPWARRQRCNGLSLRMSEAQQRFNFADGAAAFRAPYAAAIDDYLGHGCQTRAEAIQSFREDRQRAMAGIVDAAP